MNDEPRYPIHTVEQARYSLMCAWRDFLHEHITREEYLQVRAKCEERIKREDSSAGA